MSTCDVLIFGCGYLGISVARRALSLGLRVAALTRSPIRAESLGTLGIIPIVGDWLDARSLTNLPEPKKVLVAVGYDRSGGRSQRDVYVEGLRNALAVLPESARLVYCSSTGVFHQTDGGWVDESSPCRPTREGGRAHLEAEELIWRLRPELSTVVLRLAGLYGPQRAPRSRELVAGIPVPAAPEGWLNLIHRDDAASAVLSAWEHLNARRTYVVSDGHPVLRRHYYEELARLLRAPTPTFVPPDAETPKGARANADKRVWSHRLRSDLLPRLAYPTYREGLKSCFPRK